ncbi:hypothetical protein LEP1GSC127_4727 [Leptospira kirschneri str. 200801925]|nr:hypothetical protein LEP1GSC127_4727 [Leptospira kirschneri str. 200801925]
MRAVPKNEFLNYTRGALSMPTLQESPVKLPNSNQTPSVDKTEIERVFNLQKNIFIK